MKKTLEEQARDLDPLVGPQALILAAVQAEELEAKNALLIPKKDYICRKAIEFAADLKEADSKLQEKMARGCSIFADKIGELPLEQRSKYRQELERAYQQILFMTDFTVDLEKKAEALLPCSSYQEAFGFSLEMMEFFYQVGYALFHEKNFLDASCVFCTLVHFNSDKPNYWIAWALAEKFLQNYQGALLLFSSVVVLDPENAVAHINCADLYLELGEVNEALKEGEALAAIIEKQEEGIHKESLKSAWQSLQQRIASRRVAS